MRLRAHAKINLTLDVLGRRADGYHEVRSVMQTIALADHLEITTAARLSLDAQPAWLANEHNLVMRAARELQRYSGYRGGARIVLRKHIPVSAGLGGGSSDAAATLRGLVALWGLHVPHATLVDIAATIGSDVPYFLWGGTALVAGRGEQVQPLPPLAPLDLVLVKPPEGVSTARVFGRLSPDAYTAGAASASFIEAVLSPPDQWRPHNALQETTQRLCPSVREVLAALRASGATPVLMSGSGPSCFGIFPGRPDAEVAVQAMRGHGWEAWATRTVDASAPVAQP